MISTSTMRSQDGQQAAGLSRPKINASSSQLTPDENEAVFRLLGRKSQTLNTAVVQIYKTEGSAHSHWKKKYTGVLCFIKDSAIRSYFLRAYCLIKNELIWEHEIYDNMKVVKSRPFLLTFEGDDGYVGLNFVSEDECESFFRIVDATIETRNRKRVDKRNRQKPQVAPSVPVQPARSSSLLGKTSSPLDVEPVQLRNNKIGSLSMAPAQPATKNLLPNNFGFSGSAGKDKKRKVTKADISKPTNFVHITHVGWSDDKGFDMSGNENDEMLNSLLSKAGVSETDLKDRDTRVFIEKFILTHMGTVKTDAQNSPTEPPQQMPPPVPSRQIHHSHNGNQRSAPPPPPARAPPLPTTAPGAARAPPPPPTRPPPINAAPPPPPSSTVCPPAAAPPAPPTSSPPAPPAPPPPPPPPPMPVLETPIVPQAQEASQTKPAAPVQIDARSALMDEIRNRKGKLAPVEKVESSSSVDPRSELMDQIRVRGYELKPVGERKLAEQRQSDNGTVGTDALAEALRRALDQRSNATNYSDDERSTSSDNDWSE